MKRSLEDAYKLARATDQDIIRFHSETSTVSKLSHPNIIKIYNTGDYDGLNFLVMEYVEGTSLYKIFKSGYIFSVEESVDIVMKMCKALEYIHNSGVIHRDLKPGNIIISLPSQGESISIKLIDFGLAQLKDFSNLEDEDEIVGTFS